jgi:hypothetical protein
MKLIFFCLAVGLLAIGCESVDQAVCKFCQDTITKIQSISPAINPDQATQLTAQIRGFCDNEKLKDYGLSDLCKEGVDAVVAPVLKKAGDDGKYDVSDCNAIQLC